MSAPKQRGRRPEQRCGPERLESGGKKTRHRLDFPSEVKQRHRFSARDVPRRKGGCGVLYGKKCCAFMSGTLGRSWEEEQDVNSCSGFESEVPDS